MSAKCQKWTLSARRDSLGIRAAENVTNMAEVFLKPLVGLTEVALTCAMIGIVILRPSGIIGEREIAAMPIFRIVFRFQRPKG